MIADRRGKIIEPAFVWSCFRFCVRDRNRVPRVSSPGGRGYRTLRRLQENEKVNFENFFFGFTNATEVVTSEDERCRLWAEVSGALLLLACSSFQVRENPWKATGFRCLDSVFM